MSNFDGGYIQISKKFRREIYGYDLTYRQKEIFNVLLDESLGWQRATTKDIPASTIADITGIASSHVRADLRVLIAKGFIVVVQAATGTRGAQYLIPRLEAELATREQSRQFKVDQSGQTETVPLRIEAASKKSQEDRNGPPRRTETVPLGGPKRSPSNTCKIIKECSKGEPALYKANANNEQANQQLNLNAFATRSVPARRKETDEEVLARLRAQLKPHLDKETRAHG